MLFEPRWLMLFPLLGFDSADDSVFINETVQRLLRGDRHCIYPLPTLPENRSSLGQAKNGAVVCRLVAIAALRDWRTVRALGEAGSK